MSNAIIYNILKSDDSVLNCKGKYIYKHPAMLMTCGALTAVTRHRGVCCQIWSRLVPYQIIYVRLQSRSCTNLFLSIDEWQINTIFC